MKLTLAMLLIVFLAFSGYHLTFRPLKLPLFARSFYLTGTEFLFLGLLLGPASLNLLDVDTQRGLAPVNNLLLGWIGLLVGFQIELPKLRRFSRSTVLAAVTEGLITFLLVFVVVSLFLDLFQGFRPPDRLPVALTLSAAAACTAQTGLALLDRQGALAQRELILLLRSISSLDGFGALILFGLAFFFNPVWMADLSWPAALFRGVAVSLGTGIGTLLLFLLFLSQRRGQKDLVLGVIGMVLLTSGFAAEFGFSPFLTNVFLGAGLVNLSREKERIYHLLLTTEKPAYLLVLLFLGLNWEIHRGWLPVLAVFYCFWRFLAKNAAGWVISESLKPVRRYPRMLGYGMLEQGGLALAILLDFQNQFPPELARPVVGLVLWAVIFNEFLAPYFLNRLMRKEAS